MASNCIKQLLILVSAITGCDWISDFDSLVGVPMCFASSAVELKSVR